MNSIRQIFAKHTNNIITINFTLKRYSSISITYTFKTHENVKQTRLDSYTWC